MDEATLITRRSIIIGAASLCIVPAKALAQMEPIVEGVVPPLPPDLAAYQALPAYRPHTVSAPVGTHAPSNEEIQVGRAILTAAPYNTAPINVARYFFDLGQRLQDSRAAYVREWPIRANPVIQNFFAATETTPHGDVTPWCAAFVNWCIARAKSTTSTSGISRSDRFTDGSLRATSRSSASGSFRCWQATGQPQPGDLVVFREPGSEQRCGGRGHVAFYYGEADGGYIRILGGNQLLKGTGGAVTVSRYPRNGGEHGRLRFLGFRTAAALH